MTLKSLLPLFALIAAGLGVDAQKKAKTFHPRPVDSTKTVKTGTFMSVYGAIERTPLLGKNDVDILGQNAVTIGGRAGYVTKGGTTHGAVFFYQPFFGGKQGAQPKNTNGSYVQQPTLYETKNIFGFGYEGNFPLTHKNGKPGKASADIRFMFLGASTIKQKFGTTFSDAKMGAGLYIGAKYDVTKNFGLRAGVQGYLRGNESINPKSTSGIAFASIGAAFQYESQKLKEHHPLKHAAHRNYHLRKPTL